MGHDHNHGVDKRSYDKAFAVGILLNTAFITAEIIYGIQANSLALLADAGHNAGDVLGLVLAWGAAILAKKKSSERFTYGLQSSTIMAALTNAILLLVAVGGIGWEAIKRFENVETNINSQTVIWVALFGIFVNGITAFFFMSGGKKDLNIRGAFLHMAADALVSLGVVISGIVMMKTGWLLIDPIVSLVIAAMIVAGTWKLLTDSVKLALHAVPENVDYAKVKTYLAGLENVKEVHDLHIWAMSTSDVALSAHLLMQNQPDQNFLREVEHELDHDFGINHSTIQIEVGDSAKKCELVKRHNH
jgi:cobalt-zinc-cadmium efflux system protein